MATSIVWPATLPQRFLQQGFTETPPDTLLVTDFDVGPGFARRRSTCGVRKFSGRMYLDATKKALFDTFVRTTLKGGALTFMFPHPTTQVSTEMWLARGEKIGVGSPEGAYVTVTFSVECKE